MVNTSPLTGTLSDGPEPVTRIDVAAEAPPDTCWLVGLVPRGVAERLNWKPLAGSADERLTSEMPDVEVHAEEKYVGVHWDEGTLGPQVTVAGPSSAGRS